MIHQSIQFLILRRLVLITWRWRHYFYYFRFQPNRTSGLKSRFLGFGWWETCLVGSFFLKKYDSRDKKNSYTLKNNGPKVHFFITYLNFFYFENRDRFLKTDFTIGFVVGQNLGKSEKRLKIWKRVEPKPRNKGWFWSYFFVRKDFFTLGVHTKILNQTTKKRTVKT